MTEAEAVSKLCETESHRRTEGGGGGVVVVLGCRGLLPHTHYLKISATGNGLKSVKDRGPACVGEEPGRKYYQRKDKCTL